MQDKGEPAGVFSQPVCADTLAARQAKCACMLSQLDRLKAQDNVCG